MPWQRDWVDVLGEYDPDTGVPFYREAFYTVPRQSGKTAVMLAWAVDRALSWGSPQKIAWTAQTGKDGRDKWLDELYPQLEHSPISSAFRRMNRGMGNESMVFQNDSVVRLLSTSEESGHGSTLHAAALDEIFADTDMRRHGSFTPAMNTVANAQMLVTSTAGTHRSVLYNAKRAQGRRMVEEDVAEGICYLEYSAPPDWDPHDEESWWTFMPALGHMIGPNAVKHAMVTMEADPEQGLAEFKRAYGNIPTATVDDELIPLQAWERIVGSDVAPEGRLVFALAVSEDRSSAAVAVSDMDGRCEVIRHDTGVGWVPDLVNHLCLEHSAEVLVDSSGPAGALLERLDWARPVNSRDLARACGAFYDAVCDGRGVQIRRSPTLDAAVRGVVKKTLSDAWSWSRRGSAADVSPLEAVTLAWWAASVESEGPQVW